MKLVHGLLVSAVWAMAALGCGAAPDEAPGSEEGVQSVEQDVSSNALTKKQESKVLKLIDDICGDSWCEGDHDFHFDSLTCTHACGKAAGTCRVGFRLFPSGSDLKTGPTFTRTCKTNGFTGFDSLVDTAPNGYQSLNMDYYDALTACISEVEAKLPPL